MLRAPILAFVLVLAGCREDADPAGPWTWATTTAAAQGMDAHRLVELLDEIAARELDMHSLLVVRHGAIVLDASFFPYDGSRPHDVASCTKSLTSIAVGLAIADGAIDGVEAPLVSVLPSVPVDDPDGRKAEITVADALTMTAGLACVGGPVEQTLIDMQASDDYVAFTLDLPMAAAPGSVWNYCGSVSHLLSAAVGHATGTPTDAWLRAELFDPIGIGEVSWPRDPQGVAHGWGDARLVPRDLARLGVLLLQRGEWRGETLLDPAWIDDAMTQRAVDDASGVGYGYQWWVAADRGVFYANGRGGQNLFVAPELDAVVVTTGSADTAHAAAYAEVLVDVLLPAIVGDDALPEDPDAQARLDAAIADAARPPAAEAAAPPPAMAAELAGLRHIAQDNPFGWSSFALAFAGAEGTITIAIGDESTVASIGFDGVPRVTDGVRLSADPRHADARVALVGQWLDDTTLRIGFDTIEAIDAGTITFGFFDGGAVVAVYERTFLGTTLIFRADVVG